MVACIGHQDRHLDSENLTNYPRAMGNVVARFPLRKNRGNHSIVVALWIFDEPLAVAITTNFLKEIEAVLKGAGIGSHWPTLSG
jgi:hypothetical protein